MKPVAQLRAVCLWANMSAATIGALLQRLPAPRLAAAAGELVETRPVSLILKTAGIAAAALGAVDSLAGATYLATSVTPDPPNGVLPPFQVAVGVPITPLAFTIEPLLTIGSWKISGVLPPGLTLSTLQPNGGSLTGPGGGILDATSATNTLTTPLLEGTPTGAGTYLINLQGFWYGGESGGPTGKGISAVYPFTIVVSATAPQFTVQPTSVTVTGGTVVLNAVAQYANSYQWILNGTTPVAGGNGPILRIENAAAAPGTYTCVAANGQGSTTSNPATVTIASTSNIGRLINISTRSEVGTGSSIQIAGFVVGGAGVSGNEPLLIRGSGPALTALGVAGALPDPQLQVFSGSTLLATNDGWLGDAAITAAAAADGAFAWSDPTSHDAALVFPAAPGAYTAQISGESNDTGVALVEIYDSTPAASYNPSKPRLVNISARVQVGTGGNVLIAGFVIGGATARTMLIRASGPALVPFGVANTLPDPELTLFSGTSVLASDSGWAGNPAIASTAAAVGAFGWSDPASHDSALLMTLPPGAYTAQIDGAGGDTGVALVELYEVP
jgi:hypothetical protein